MSGHTPGPWRFVPWHIAEGPSEVRAPEGWLICTTSSDADAELIAKAPELQSELTACRARVKELERITNELIDTTADAMIKARAALRGETT